MIELTKGLRDIGELGAGLAATSARGPNRNCVHTWNERIHKTNEMLGDNRRRGASGVPRAGRPASAERHRPNVNL